MFKIERDPDHLSTYLVDESGYRGAAAGVIHLDGPATIASVLSEATRTRTPVVFSARRTSVTGAAIPEGGWVLALPEDSSPALVRVDVDARTATAPARTLLIDLERAVEAAGLFFPPDPTSRPECSLGGAVACNASGARSFGYGATGRWVEALDVVLASGERLTLRRGEHPPVDGHFQIAGHRVPCPGAAPRGLKQVAGYTVSDTPDAIDLFIGSEGTLAYIHEITVRLLPKRPIFAALTFWDDEAAALRFVATLQTRPTPGLEPMSLEWFDTRSLQLASEAHPRFKVPADAVAALFIEQRHAPEAAADVAMAWYEALLDAGVPDTAEALRIPRNRRDLEDFRAFRHAVPEAANALMRQRGLRKLGTDLSYPKGWLEAMYAHYQRAVNDVPAHLRPEDLDALGGVCPEALDTAIWGHIGDTHLHVNLLPRDAHEAKAAKLLYAQLARHCAANGGSISAEHGVGKSKRALLAETAAPERLAELRAVKDALDPMGILAPGNLFSVELQHA